MSWLPHLHIVGTCIAEPDFEAEGVTVQFIWLHWVFELTLCKIDRRFGESADAR